MEAPDGLCPLCRTYLGEAGECPNWHCPAHGRTEEDARFSSRPAPRRSFQDLIAVSRPGSGASDRTAADGSDSGPPDASTEDSEDRPTPIEVPVTQSGLRRPMSGEYAIETFDDSDGKASNGES